MSNYQRPLLLFVISVLVSWFLFWIGCSSKPADQEKYVAKNRKVEVVKESDGRYVLYRNGEPYYIKGAAGYDFYDRLADYGGNSVRVWHTDDAQRILDEAHKNGLTVTLGLWMAREREGFNYYDKDLVQQQLEELKQVVLKYKDHPALLMWGVGNELYAEGSNVKVWDAVNQVAEMIHEVDPDHPTTTTVMNVPVKIVNIIVDRCPALDILSINSFGGLYSMHDELAKTDWKGPYVVSEFGAMGYWESYLTWWMAPIEQTSSEKAEFTRKFYKDIILKDTTQCLGSYVFMWGNKQETTPTWFSMINNDGEETEMVQVMQELWSGTEAPNKAPYIAYLKLNNQFAFDQVYLRPEQTYLGAAYLFDPDQDSVQVHWEVLPEVKAEDGNTGQEETPQPVQGLLSNFKDNKLILKTPKKEGAYRLYLYARDGNKNIATANIPFYVMNY
ncbi:glycoside hydrolase family 2 TIM barrel-domain containing protein [uncultured Pontibacter sp.]|uniref:glycoside hydrolase family 2 TIM barrel-domain containing protein n=1 Tax=uncultured Pontibacter sp. TaxID=453356 RepID=UPI002620BC13|nr:glycoside hydrolase family 2 TIM barrel-domain containing protein [uncultured Pontibacter sp.]